MADLWDLKVEPATASITANGADNTNVTFKLVDKVTGQVDENADNVVLKVSTTRGTLANDRITIQDGKATVLLTSEFSNKNVTAKIDAQIIEASGDYNELIGKVVGTAEVQFKVTSTDDVTTKTLVAAESNQADRFTLFFDKNVTLSDFVQTDAQGNLLYNYYEAATVVAGDNDPLNDAFDGSGVTADDIPEGAEVYHALIEESVGVVGSIKVTQTASAAGVPDFTTDESYIQGIRPVQGNSNAMEVILANPNTTGEQLTDNKRVYIETNVTNSIKQVTKSNVSFVLTDARNPEVTSVKAEGMNRVVVKFSEAVADGNIRFDGLSSSDNDLLTSAGTENEITLGEFNALTFQDTRDTAVIDLLPAYDWDGAGTVAIEGYFKAGNHSIQISNLEDHATVTDSKNIGTTQTLQFNVADDKSRPTATVKTESAEQFRVTFNKELVESDADVKAALQLQIYNDTTKKWHDLDDATGTAHPEVDTTPDWEVEKVSGGQYIVELDTDWTEVFDTENTNNNYYNYKYRIVVAEETVTNKANGLENEAELILNLSASGSHLLTNDTKSPVINDIESTTNRGEYRVTMNEPVKLPGLDNASDTENQDQAANGIPAPTVQFEGKDKDGKTVTFSGTVQDYTSKDKSDTQFLVEWTPNAAGDDPQDVVDAGGSTKWTVIVKSISDDVGNTAATLTKDFTLVKTADNVVPFEITSVEQAGVVGNADAANADVLTLTFSSAVVNTGGVNDATALSQYSLNGLTLPAGTSITVDDADGDIENGYEIVIITLPNGYLNADTVVGEANNTVTVNKNLLSNTSVKLTGQFEWVASN